MSPLARSAGETGPDQTGRRQGKDTIAMTRTAILATFALIGFVIAFATALPAARSGTPVEMAAADRSGEVPLNWVGGALADMPFLTPGR
jgi:hypothetical protein